ncbi:MAG: hypothetical protein ACTSQJ_13500 [Promethearchaeota archaeon]
MVIREAGLLFRGFTLINSCYHQSSQNGIDQDLRSGLITAILNFAESAFSTGLIEYLESDKYVIAFTEDKIKPIDSEFPEPLIGYAILDKKKKIDKYINKVIQPLLSQCMLSFKGQYAGINLSEVSQFRSFKKVLDR